jgi:hypothetical protein
MSQTRRNVFERFRERRAHGVEVDEYERAPGFDAKLGQAVILFRKLLYAIEFRRPVQAAFKRVCPAVVAALKNFAIAAPFGYRPRAMAANIRKCSRRLPLRSRNRPAR